MHTFNSIFFELMSTDFDYFCKGREIAISNFLFKKGKAHSTQSAFRRGQVFMISLRGLNLSSILIAN